MNVLQTQLDMVSRSAKVKRYHTEHTVHQQTVGEHTYGVMWLVCLICTPSRELLLAALSHDTGEYKTGDIPAPTKRGLGLSILFDKAEREVLMEAAIEPPLLNQLDMWRLKTADCLEGALFCLSELQRGNRLILEALTNYLSYLDGLKLDGKALEIFNIIKAEYELISSK